MGNNTTTNKNLFIAIPVYRQCDFFFVSSLVKLLTEFAARRPDWGLGIDFHAGECPIGRARNDLTHRFLSNKEFTHILFIDSDIMFSYEQVEKILSHDEDIVGGFYTKKQEGNVAPVCNRLDTVDSPNERGLLKMKYMGTGFLRISRRVFEVMIQEIGNEIGYIEDGDRQHKYDFWRMGVHKDKDGNKRWLSEDWQFCQFALDLGFDIWADASCILRHSGMVVYPLSYQIPQLYSSSQLESMAKTISAPEQSEAVGAGATDSPQTASAP